MAKNQLRSASTVVSWSMSTVIGTSQEAAQRGAYVTRRMGGLAKCKGCGFGNDGNYIGTKYCPGCGAKIANQ